MLIPPDGRFTARRAVALLIIYGLFVAIAFA